MKRHTSYWGLLLVGLSVVLSEAAEMETVVYKRVGELEIKADIHTPDGKGPFPVVVWIHGGALINGHRAGVSRRVKNDLLESKIAIVSIDYRLAPETKLPEIIRDVEDAFAWLQKNGAKKGLDVARVAVMGGSAGGYLTLTSGYRARPRPRALVAFWGYGDLIGPWYSKPSPHPRHHRVKMSKKEAYAQVSGPAVSDSRRRKGNGGAFYQYCRQQGTWPTAVSGGWDPVADAKRFHEYIPVKNVDKAYPPTLMIHGTKDTDVPYEQSVMMAKEFKRQGITHRLISIEGGEHGLGGGDRKKIDQAYRDALAFVVNALQRK